MIQRRKLLYTTGAAGLAMILPRGLLAQEKQKVFALVPKLVGVPFYADVEAGCKEQAKKMGVECLFTGPTQVDEGEQVRVIRDLITRGVSGLAIAPNNPDSVAAAINTAQAKGIPVITFDSDAPKTKRSTFVGTNNRVGGEMAGKAFRAALPGGGTYAIITGGLAAANLNDRMAGFKAALGDGFKEAGGSPFPCEDDSSRAIQIMQDVLAKNPGLSGFFFAGGWPMFAPEAYTRALRSRADEVKAGKFVVVSFDAQEPQLRLIKSGLATALIGQRPRAMGAQSLIVLNALLAKQSVEPVYDTGVDLIDAKNVDQFLGK